MEKISSDKIIEEYEKKVSREDIEKWVSTSQMNIISIIKKEIVECLLYEKFREITRKMKKKGDIVEEVRMFLKMFKFLREQGIMELAGDDEIEEGKVAALWGAGVYIERDLDEIILISTSDI